MTCCWGPRMEPSNPPTHHPRRTLGSPRLCIASALQEADAPGSRTQSAMTATLAPAVSVVRCCNPQVAAEGRGLRGGFSSLFSLFKHF